LKKEASFGLAFKINFIIDDFYAQEIPPPRKGLVFKMWVM